MEIEQGPWGMVRCQAEHRDIARAIRTHMQQVKVQVAGIVSEAAGANAARPDGTAANIRQCRKTSRISWLSGKKNFRISWMSLRKG